MVRTAGARVSSKPRKRKLIPKQCLFCNRSYHGSPQSKFCDPYCVQRACRRRKEALIKVFADFLYERSTDLTAMVLGTPIQITAGQARRKAEQCIEQRHEVFKLRLEQIGYVYNEREKQWLYQPRLLP